MKLFPTLIFVLSTVWPLSLTIEDPSSQQENPEPTSSGGPLPGHQRTSIATTPTSIKCEWPTKTQNFSVSGSCELYRGGNLCLSRKNQTVYVDGRKIYYDQPCISKILETFVEQFSRLRSPKIEALSNETQKRCFELQLTGICYYFFPDCNKTQWKKLCRESCMALFNTEHICLDMFEAARNTLTTMAHTNFIYPRHIDSNDFSCENLPSEAESDCYSFPEILLPMPASSMNRLTIILCVAVPAIALIGISIGLAVYFSRRAFKKKLRTMEAQGDSFHNSSYSAVRFIDASIRNRIDSMQVTYSPESSLIVDPSYTLDDFPEISLDNIGYVKDIGEGAFGKVFLGTLAFGPDESSKPLLVAVKTLKVSDEDETAEKDFFAELHIVTQLRHANIVSLLAKWITDKPYCIILEFMCHGDLCQVLRSAKIGDKLQLGSDVLNATEENEPDVKHVLTVDSLVLAIMQVCCGLEYLASRRFIHRDIAARNCLVGKGFQVKISDFGLSRSIYSKDYYKMKGCTLLPVRWMAPESIMYGKFLIESDVWSFGVLMWEVFTLGKQPFYGMSNEEVVTRIAKSGTLSDPDDFCPSVILDLMKTCWKFQPKERPPASQLCEDIQKFMSF